MQSMKVPYLSSLGARRAKHGFGHRTTWAMWVVAVLLAVLAFTVPMQQSASAQTPSGTVTITVDEDSIDYETATATITVTGGATLFDRLDVDKTENWYVSVKYNIKDTNDYSESQRGGPGAIDPDFVFGPRTNGVSTATVKLDKWSDGDGTPNSQVLINSLVPGSTYVVEAVLAFDNPNYRTADRATDEFTTLGDCVRYVGAEDKREWHSRGGLRIDDHKITRTSMVVAVSVPWDIAPLNSGICLHYTRTGGGSTIKDSAFVYNQGSGSRIGWIIETGLKPGTHYDFTIGIHHDLSGFNSGIGARTLGPQITVTVENIEQTSATVTVAIPAEEGDTGERTIHLAYYKAADEYEPDLDDKKVTLTPKNTENRSTSFNLSNLISGTDYTVDVSLISGFPSYETKSETFPTKPGKPTGLTVAPGDEQLELSWTKPAGGDAIDWYLVQWKSGIEAFENAATDDREETVYSTETTIETTIFDLTNGTPYTVRVQAVNKSGKTPSDDADGTPMTIPNAPNNLGVDAGNEKLTLTWEEPTAKVGVNVTGYVVQWKSGSQTFDDAATDDRQETVTTLTQTVTYVILDLANDTLYDVRVRALNSVVLDDQEDYEWTDGSGTPRPEPIVTGVTVADATITRTEATATVAIDNQTGDGQTVHLHYRKTTESGWTPVLPPKDVTATATSETFNLNSLTGNTDYVVEAWLATTSSTKASVEFTTDPVEPDAPRNVEITGFGDGELTVAWDAPLGNGGSTITGYKVQWKEETTPNWDSPSEEPDDASPCTIDILTNGTRYDVRVLAVNDVGDGPPSGDVEGTPSTRPKPPTITDITHGHQKLTITWTAPTGADTGGSDITGYIVQWKKGTDPYNATNQATPPASLYEITNLLNGTEYTVRVFAVNESYPDEPSDESNEMTGTPSTKPQPPTDVTITGFGDESLAVSWTSPTNADTGGSPVTGFKIQWKLNSDADWNTNTYTEIDDDDNQSPYTIEGVLTNGTKYDVRVIAVNINGDSRESGSATGTPSKKPNPPTGVDITDYGDGWLEVTWNAVTGTGTGGSDIKNYIVQWKSGTDDYDTTNQGTPTESPYRITSLKNGTEYTVRVLAVNETYPNDPSADPGDGTNEDKETPRTKPKPPTGVNIKDYGDGFLKVGWTAPEDNGGSALASFKMQWKSGSDTFDDAATDSREQTVAAVSGTTAYETTISNLTNGTKYTVQVLAVNGNRASDNISDSSNTASGTPSTTPDAPKSVTITNEGDRTLTVTWEPPGEIGGLAITNYKVQWMDEDDTDWTSPANDKGATDRSHVIRDLTNGEIYTVQVFAKNANGYSNQPGQVTGRPSKKPNPPTDVKVSAHGDKWLEVTWTEPEDKGGLPTTYIVQWKPDGEEYDEQSRQHTSATSPHRITSLLNGTEYTVHVLAENARGKSDTSNQPTGTPMTKPQPPTDVSIAGFGNKSLTVAWTAPTGIEGTGGSPITGFKIQWKLNSEADWDTNTYTEIDDDDGQSPYTIEEVLTNGTMYDVRVLAVNDNDNVDDNTSDPSDAATGTPSRKPHKPTGVDITDYGDGWLEVTWTPLTPEATGGSPIKNYIVQWKKGTDDYNTTNQGTPTTSLYKITNLENGTEYTVRVLGVNEAYPDTPGEPSDGVTETPRTIPGPPTELGVISGDKELTVSWTAPVPEKNGGAGINQYIVQWKSGDQEYDTLRQETTSNTSQVIKELTNGTPYSIQVRADNGEEPEGEQDYNWGETTGTPMTVPGAPTNLEVEEGDRQLIVSWVAPTETGGVDIEIDHFVVQWKLKTVDNWNTPGEHTTTDETVLTDTITGLDNGEMNDIRVRADNDVEGQTFQWAYTTGKPRTIPDPPTSLRVTPSDGQLTLSWVAPRDKGGLTINRYIVQWKSGIQQYDTSRQATPTTTSQVIGQLTNGTPHFVRVRADNGEEADSYNWATGNGTPAAAQSPPPPPQQSNPPPQRSPVNPTPPVIKSPEVSSVIFTDILQTSANATVKIMYAGTSQKTVRLHYRVDGATAWSTPPKSDKTSGSSKTFTLSDLTAGTTYEVQAWLDSSLPPAGTKIYEFDTLDELAPVPDAAISNLKCENIGQTSAIAMVEIANAGTDMKEVFLKHSIQGEDEWTMLPFPTITYDDDTSIPLTGLTEGTTYEVAVALSNDFSGMVIEQCTTLLLDPVVSGISVDRRKQTSVWANVSIANANGEDQTVHLRYRTTTPQGEWSDSAKTTTSTDSASKEIAGLTADTEYEVQASLDSTFPDELTKNATFTTLRFPSISNLEVEDETKNSATAVITMADPDGSSQTIHLRYRTTTPQGAWSSTPPGSSTTSEASIGLTGLAPDTEYEVEVSLKSDFVVSETETFRTLPLDPVVSGINVDRRKQTSVWANVSIANANGEDQTVHLRYRTTTPRGDWIDDLKTTSDTETASKELSGLTAGTEYDVQASLDDSFPSSRTKSATFKTLRWPSIASFEVESVGRNGATVSATIADSRGVPQTVHVRHRATGYIAWRPTQQVDSVGDIASLRLRGLSSGIEYIAEASLDESFPSDETRSVTFTTVKRKDDDDASSSGSGIVQAARAENIPLLGFSPQMLRFVAVEGGDNPASQTFSVWNRAQGAMNFTLSNHEEWLYQDPLSGVSTGPADVVAISTSVDISGLAGKDSMWTSSIYRLAPPAGRQDRS